MRIAFTTQKGEKRYVYYEYIRVGNQVYVKWEIRNIQLEADNDLS